MARTRQPASVATLAKTVFFEGVTASGLAQAGRDARFLAFAPESEVIAAGEQSDDVSILLAGHARVTLYSPDGRAVDFRRLDPGAMFGEFAAVDGRPRSASVEAIKACTVARLPAVLFWQLMRQEPAFAGAVLAHLVDLSRSLTERIFEFSTLAVNNRIHAELLRMVRHDLAGSGRPWIDPAPTHAEIAARISTHREAVSRELSRLTSLGVVGKRGSALLVKDLARLERMVRDAVAE